MKVGANTAWQMLTDGSTRRPTCTASLSSDQPNYLPVPAVVVVVVAGEGL